MAEFKMSPEPRGTKVLHQALLVAPCALCPHELCHIEVHKLCGQISSITVIKDFLHLRYLIMREVFIWCLWERINILNLFPHLNGYILKRNFNCLSILLSPTSVLEKLSSFSHSQIIQIYQIIIGITLFVPTISFLRSLSLHNSSFTIDQIIISARDTLYDCI